MMGNQMMYGPYSAGMWMFFHFIFWVIVIAGVVLLIVWLVRQQGKHDPEYRQNAALDILKQRYARGEINKEEFDRMKKDIS